MSLASDLRKRHRIHAAWRHVRRRGLQSPSSETQSEIREFDADYPAQLQSITQALQRGTFKFAPSTGVLGKTSSGKPRPIVLSPIRDRVVRRAILDILQERAELRHLFDVSTSFGGLADRGVRDAVEVIHGHVCDGLTSYIRSDIASFFTAFPRERAIEPLSALIDDEEFGSLLEDAATVELGNLASLGDDASFFPLEDIGVAQGSALSPLLGNVVLNVFDAELNSDSGVKCIRYVDDFVLLARTPHEVQKAFARATAILKGLGLEAYGPGVSPKAKQGDACDGLNVLGCVISPNMIRPSQSAGKRVIKQVGDAMRESLREMRRGATHSVGRSSYVSTLRKIHLILKGWGDQYAFCNAKDVMGNLDREVDKILDDYQGQAMKIINYANLQSEDRRTLLGVHSLRRSKSKPIIS